jgi:nucleotide-binding universal stress UspA family protein
MIVMGTRGLTGLDHVLVGSVTERVLGRASVPVVSVK